MSQSNRTAILVGRIGLSILCLAAMILLDTGLPLAVMYVASSLFSAFLMYMFRKPPPIDVMLIAVLGPAATALHTWVWFHEWYRPRVFIILSGFGVAAFVVLTMRLIWSSGEDKRRKLLEILVPAGSLTALLLASTWLNQTGKLWPNTLDLSLFSFDASLGIHASFWMGRMFRNHFWFGMVGTTAYFFILIAMVLAHIAYEKRRPREISRTFVLEVCFVAGAIGYCFYQFLPACGPLYAFPNDFPFGGIPVHDVVRLALEPIPIASQFPRNAMPSLHMTWALLIWWNLRSCGRVLHGIGLAFAILTAMGTLGTGEHYLIDLVVAFPFALMIQGICRRDIGFSDPRRWKGIIAGLMMTLAWIVALRETVKLFWISPVIPWTAVAVTIAGSLYLSFPLTRFERSNEVEMEQRLAQLAASATQA